MISKYQKSWYCKILTILLALVIVVAVPFSSLQAYAREEGQPTETFYEKDILPDTNTKTDSDGSEDELSTVTDSHRKLIDNDQDSVDQISSTEAEPEVIILGSPGPTIWEVSDSDELENALNNFSSGDTIKLVANITYYKGIEVANKSVTFDVDEYTLNVINNSDNGLEVKSGGQVHLNGGGEFIVSGSPCGVKAVGSGAKAEVTYASGSGTGGIGAYAYLGGQIIVNGDVNGPVGAEALGEGSQLTITGNIKGTYTHGVKVSQGGEITVHGKVTSTIQDGVYAEQGEIVVQGDVEGQQNGASVSKNGHIHITGNVTGLGGSGVYAKNGGTAVIDGDVTGWKGSGAYCVQGEITVNGNAMGSDSGVKAGIKNSTITVKGDVIANSSNSVGAEIANYGLVSSTGEVSGKIIIDGEIQTKGVYIRINDVDKDEESKDAESSLEGYNSYSEINPFPIKPGGTYGTSVVFVKSNMECEINGVQYPTLGDALEVVQTGETIKLLKDIIHTDPISVSGKVIKFDLGDYDLLLDTSAEDSFDYALTVEGSGKINLIGTGQFNVKGSFHGINILGADSEATVHNVEITGGGNCIRMYGSGSDLVGGKITVNGDISAENGTGVSVNAKNSEVIVGGNIRAGNLGVNIAANPNTVVTVEGDITVINYNPEKDLKGIHAYSGATVEVGGHVTVRGVNCTGVHTSGSTISIGGNLVSSGKGVDCSYGGMVEITGSLTAGDPFIVVGFAEMTPDKGIENEDGFLEYSDGNNTVIIGSIGIPASEFTITVETDGHGTANASLYSAAEGEEITLTATPDEGHIFKEWQVVSGDVSIEGNQFTMPGENVTIKAIFEAVSVESYTVTVEGSYAGITGAGNYDAGDTVNIYAGSRSGYTFNGWTSKDGVVFADASNATTTFVMPDKNVTVTANWTYKGSGGRSRGSSSEKMDNTVTSPEAKKFIDIEKHWAEESIDYVADLGLFYGTSDTTFSPDAAMSRGMMVTVLGRLAEADVSGYVSSFDDVIDSIYYAKYTEWARVKGIALGVGGNKFAPDASITRQDLVVMLVRYASVMGLKVPDLNVDVAFSDVESIASYAKEATEAMQKAGIINGRPDGIFDPDASVTRAEVSAILHRFLLLFSDSGDLV